MIFFYQSNALCVPLFMKFCDSIMRGYMAIWLSFMNCESKTLSDELGTNLYKCSSDGTSLIWYFIDLITRGGWSSKI
jgi:hypothetical protein